MHHCTSFVIYVPGTYTILLSNEKILQKYPYFMETGERPRSICWIETAGGGGRKDGEARTFFFSLLGFFFSQTVYFPGGTQG